MPIPLIGLVARSVYVELRNRKRRETLRQEAEAVERDRLHRLQQRRAAYRDYDDEEEDY